MHIRTPCSSLFYKKCERRYQQLPKLYVHSSQKANHKLRLCSCGELHPWPDVKPALNQDFINYDTRRNYRSNPLPQCTRNSAVFLNVKRNCNKSYREFKS